MFINNEEDNLRAPAETYKEDVHGVGNDSNLSWIIFVLSIQNRAVWTGSIITIISTADRKPSPRKRFIFFCFSFSFP